MASLYPGQIDSYTPAVDDSIAFASQMNVAYDGIVATQTALGTNLSNVFKSDGEAILTGSALDISGSTTPTLSTTHQTVLELHRDTKVQADTLELLFQADDTNDTVQTYSKIDVYLSDTTAGSKDAVMRFYTMRGNNFSVGMQVAESRVRINPNAADYDFQIYSDDDSPLVHVDGNNNAATFGNTTYGGKVLIDQNDNTGAIPVLGLDQADISEEFINFVSTSASSVANPISEWTSGNSIQGFLRMAINNSFVWVPYYDAPSS